MVNNLRKRRLKAGEIKGPGHQLVGRVRAYLDVDDYGEDDFYFRRGSLRDGYQV